MGTFSFSDSVSMRKIQVWPLTTVVGWILRWYCKHILGTASAVHAVIKCICFWDTADKCHGTHGLVGYVVYIIRQDAASYWNTNMLWLCLNQWENRVFLGDPVKTRPFTIYQHLFVLGTVLKRSCLTNGCTPLSIGVHSFGVNSFSGYKA